MMQKSRNSSHNDTLSSQCASGLYHSSYEHDACGVGMLVHIRGTKSHELVDSALRLLENMKHRGAEGADSKTGDGAGIMVQIPHEFILLQGIPVPEKGNYGTGLVFLPKEKTAQETMLRIVLEEIVHVVPSAQLTHHLLHSLALADETILPPRRVKRSVHPPARQTPILQ